MKIHIFAILEKAKPDTKYEGLKLGSDESYDCSSE
jgi:hypothetical protein